MPAHSSLSVRDALTIVRYMLSTGEPLEATLPLSGTHTHTASAEDDGRGALVIRAVYSDNGAQGVPSHTSDAVAVLRGPLISAGTADILDGVTTTVENRTAGPVAIIASANSHIAFKGIDLTGVRRAELVASASLGQGNVGIEIRLGAPTGPLLARAALPVTQPHSGDEPSTPPAPVTMTIRQTPGVHDVYFVFKNNNRAAPMQSVMTLVHDAYFVFRYHRAMPPESLLTLSTITWLNK